MDMRKQIVYLMADTGGGHRAAANAIAAALEAKYPGQCDHQLVRMWRDYSYYPRADQDYEPTIRYFKWGWGAFYKLTNHRGIAEATMGTFNQTVFRGHMDRFVRENPADVVVAVHSVFVRPVMHAYARRGHRPPFVTVVTDLVSTHLWWYDPRVDRCLVPTQAAFDRGLLAGIPAEKMRVTGLPVDPKFADGVTKKDRARARLGWDPRKPAVLVVGGGAGMGPLYEIAQAIDALDRDCQVAVVAGRNTSLKARLEAAAWNRTPHIYGYVENMPTLMAAADILVTKAGPGTVSEACIAGVPVILSDYIPGQEDGNVTYMVKNRAGVLATDPPEVAQAVGEWLDEGPEGLARRAAAARALGRPDAVWEVAEEVWHYANQPAVRMAGDRHH
jgi:1,2-diacylglycerol 3-beta-galactosyltransferase